MIEFYIDPDSICIFSKTTCSFCHKAIGLLNNYNVNVQLIELDKITEGAILSQELFTRTKQKTVPNIFIFGKHIGGFSELNNLHNQGILSTLINQKSLIYQCNFCGKQSSDKNITCNCFPRQFDDWGAPL
jgi:glutaredoxin 3|tara:strand:+ start:4 stop:393 length:390 start_codon:yes stop_codon:yes gene_type:complete